MCGATYVLWILVSSLLTAFRLYILSYFQRRQVLFLGKVALGTSKQVEVRVEKLHPDPEITEWESPNPWDAQIGPAALPVIYPNSGRAGLRWLPLCRDTQGLFTFLSLTLILRPLKICILFSWNKDFYHEAVTHPITFSTTWKILERTLSNKFSASWIFCWASCQDVDSWSASKSAFNFWRIAVETISI